MQLLGLAQGMMRAQIAPTVGGSIAAFWSEGEGGRRIDWLRPAIPEALARCDPLAMGSFPLLPFCNRIRNGHARFEGREIRFPPNHPSVASPHPLHGIGWQRPWNVLAADPGTAELQLQVEASPAWPWRFSARQHFALRDGALHVHMSLRNEDTVAMPAGIGHHPYFPHHPGTRLQAATEAMWLADAEVMPTALHTGEVVQRLRDGVLLAELDLDNNFIGWQRQARVEWPADAQGPSRRLLMAAEPPLAYFVLYCPRGADHFCAEPVSQCTDWLNLMERHGPEPLGGARIAPGDTLDARFRLQPALA